MREEPLSLQERSEITEQKDSEEPEYSSGFCERIKPMDGGDHGRRWRNLKHRLGFKGLGCCGAAWRPHSSTLSIIETHEESQLTVTEAEQVQVVTSENNSPPLAGMNLAMALAAERSSRDEKDVGPPTEVKSLMRLLEETDGVDWRKKRRREKGVDADWVCCVCMERSKGAAFIPCGHAFCRVCSREMWVNRGSCPLCNRSILEILDIF